MIYTEEDLEQAYAIGYNEAVDDVNEYIDQESMEFSLDESYYDDYSAVEDAIMNETKSWKKKEHEKAALNDLRKIHNKYISPNSDEYTGEPANKQTRHHYRAVYNAITNQYRTDIDGKKGLGLHKNKNGEYRPNNRSHLKITSDY